MGACLKEQDSWACGAGLFAAGTHCAPCQSGCLQCSSLLECHQCVPGLKVRQGLCQQHCPPGYLTHSTGLCMACHPSCRACFGWGRGHCLDCHGQHSLLNGFCVTGGLGCPLGSFLNPFNGACGSCASECEVCHSATLCLHCQGGLALSFDRAECLPMEQCQSSCRKCDQETALCLQCMPHYALEEGVCVKKCSLRRYHARGHGLCQSCHASCKLCWGPYADQCLRCLKGRSRRGRCDRPSTCSEAPEEEECPISYFFSEESSLCQKCSAHCEYCVGALHCKDCTAGFQLVGDACQPELDCPPSTFEAEGACQQCPYNCAECDAKDCLACRTGYLLDGGCFSPCPEFHYGEYSSRQCLPCNSLCRQCATSQPDWCLACVTGYRLSQKTCLPNCPDCPAECP